MKIFTKGMVFAIAMLLIAVLAVAPASAEDNTVIPGPVLSEGWNTLSTPIALSDGALGNVISDFDSNVEVAYRWNSQSMSWAQMQSTTKLETLDAIFVEVTANSVGTTFVVSSERTSPPQKSLYAGWNFVSLANLEQMKAGYALYSVSDDVKVIISPYENRESAFWSLSWNDPAAQAKDLYPYEGYWIFMNEAGILAGFTVTPLPPGQQYTLTMAMDGEGTVDPAVGSHTYNENTSVTMTATPADGWVFDAWQLDGSSYSVDAVTTIAMDADKSVIAFFKEEGVMRAEGTIKVGAMNFNEVLVNGVDNVPGAAQFSVDEVGTIQTVGGTDPVTFMATGSTTLQIYDATGNLLATGNLEIPGEIGESAFTVELVEVPPVEKKATGTITVGGMNFNDLLVGEVTGITGATQFSVTEVATLQLIGGVDPVTFMGAGSTTLQITDDVGTLLATGTLDIPAAFGETSFEVDLVVV
jgi:hypothetical protein